MNTMDLLGLILGAVIGGTFAWLQMRALRRNEELEKQGEVPGRLRRTPGAMGRVAYLLMALVAVQVFFPQASLWWLSGGLVLAYGIPFIWRLKDKAARAI